MVTSPPYCGPDPPEQTLCSFIVTYDPNAMKHAFIQSLGILFRLQFAL